MRRGPFRQILLALAIVLAPAGTTSGQVSIQPFGEAARSWGSLRGDLFAPGYEVVAERSYSRGLSVGAGLSIVASHRLGGDIGLVYAKETLHEEWLDDQGRDWNVDARVNVVRMPLLGAVRPIGDRTVTPRIVAGPYVSVKMSETYAETCEGAGCPVPESAFDRATYGLIVGGSLGVRAGRATIRTGLRYQRDLRDWYRHRWMEGRREILLLSVGVGLRLGQ